MRFSVWWAIIIAIAISIAIEIFNQAAASEVIQGALYIMGGMGPASVLPASSFFIYGNCNGLGQMGENADS